MFIHIGNDNVIQEEDVVSIIDRTVVTDSIILEDMLEHASKNHRISGPSEEAKSVVITSDHIYYSSLSVSTLKKRASMSSVLNKLEDYSDEIDE